MAQGQSGFVRRTKSMTWEHPPTRPNSVIPTGAGANATAEWRDLEFASPPHTHRRHALPETLPRKTIARTSRPEVFSVLEFFPFEFPTFQRLSLRPSKLLISTFKACHSDAERSGGRRNLNLLYLCEKLGSWS